MAGNLVSARSLTGRTGLIVRGRCLEARIEVITFVMSRKMMLEIKRLAERNASPRALGC